MDKIQYISLFAMIVGLFVVIFHPSHSRWQDVGRLLLIVGAIAFAISIGSFGARHGRGGTR